MEKYKLSYIIPLEKHRITHEAFTFVKYIGFKNVDRPIYRVRVNRPSLFFGFALQFGT